MILSNVVNKDIQTKIMHGAKAPHSCSYPVVFCENGKNLLAVFVFFFTKDDIEAGKINRPTLWAMADIESGELIAEFDTKDRDFSDASYDVKYDVHSDGEYDTSKEYYEKAFAILDSVREKIITDGVFDKKEYAKYMDMILANIPAEYKRFYTDLSVDYMETTQNESDESSGLREIMNALAQLQSSFNEKIAQDEHKNALFDNLHRELMMYQNGTIDKKIDSMAMDIILLSDNVKRIIKRNIDSEPSEDAFKKLLKQLQGIADELEDILYRESIEPFSVPGDDVDVKKQKIIGTIDTDKEELNNKVAERGAVGYEKEDRVFRRENVKIFKFKSNQ